MSATSTSQQPERIADLQKSLGAQKGVLEQIEEVMLEALSLIGDEMQELRARGDKLVGSARQAWSTAYSFLDGLKPTLDNHSTTLAQHRVGLERAGELAVEEQDAYLARMGGHFSGRLQDLDHTKESYLAASGVIGAAAPEVGSERLDEVDQLFVHLGVTLGDLRRKAGAYAQGLESRLEQALTARPEPAAALAAEPALASAGPPAGLPANVIVLHGVEIQLRADGRPVLSPLGHDLSPEESALGRGLHLAPDPEVDEASTRRAASSFGG